jgi:glycerol uptake operon antiterminator
VLPYMPSILPELNQRLNVPFLMGGLIETESQVKSSIQGGAIAITTSKDDLWFKTFNVQSNNKNEVF